MALALGECCWGRSRPRLVFPWQLAPQGGLDVLLPHISLAPLAGALFKKIRCFLLVGPVRAVGPRLVSGCGPGTRATCSAVLFGAFEAYPPLGTTPGAPGEELATGYRMFMK